MDKTVYGEHTKKQVSALNFRFHDRGYIYVNKQKLITNENGWGATQMRKRLKWIYNK